MPVSQEVTWLRFCLQPRETWFDTRHQRCSKPITTQQTETPKRPQHSYKLKNYDHNSYKRVNTSSVKAVNEEHMSYDKPIVRKTSFKSYFIAGELKIFKNDFTGCMIIHFLLVLCFQKKNRDLQVEVAIKKQC